MGRKLWQNRCWLDFTSKTMLCYLIIALVLFGMSVSVSSICCFVVPCVESSYSGVCKASNFLSRTCEFAAPWWRHKKTRTGGRKTGRVQWLCLEGITSQMEHSSCNSPSTSHLSVCKCPGENVMNECRLIRITIPGVFINDTDWSFVDDNLYLW